MHKQHNRSRRCFYNDTYILFGPSAYKKSYKTSTFYFPSHHAKRLITRHAMPRPSAACCSTTKESVCCTSIRIVKPSFVLNHPHLSIVRCTTKYGVLEGKSNDGFPPIRYEITIRICTDDTSYWSTSLCWTVWEVALGSTLWYIRNEADRGMFLDY